MLIILDVCGNNSMLLCHVRVSEWIYIPKNLFESIQSIRIPLPSLIMGITDIFSSIYVLNPKYIKSNFNSFNFKSQILSLIGNSNHYQSLQTKV